LQRQRKLGDLVQEQGAAVGIGEQPLAGVLGAGKGAPFTWPNSSASISSDEMAAQLTGTKGRWARWDN